MWSAAPVPSACRPSGWGRKVTSEVKFTNEARVVPSPHKDIQRVGVWTDGFMVSSDYERGWPPALRLHAGKTYEVTVAVREVNPKVASSRT